MSDGDTPPPSPLTGSALGWAAVATVAAAACVAVIVTAPRVESVSLPLLLIGFAVDRAGAINRRDLPGETPVRRASALFLALTAEATVLLGVALWAARATDYALGAGFLASGALLLLAYQEQRLAASGGIRYSGMATVTASATGRMFALAIGLLLGPSVAVLALGAVAAVGHLTVLARLFDARARLTG
jgi:hypothetical protein